MYVIQMLIEVAWIGMVAVQPHIEPPPQVEYRSMDECRKHLEAAGVNVIKQIKAEAGRLDLVVIYNVKARCVPTKGKSETI